MNSLLLIAIFLLPIIIKLVRSRLEPLPNSLMSRESLVQCVLKAFRVNVDHGEIIKLSLALTEVDKSVSSSTVVDRILLKGLFQETKWSIIIKKTNQSINGIFLKSVSNYIIQIRHRDEFDDHLRVLSESQDWNPHAKFWIITVTPFKETLNVTKTITNLLWSYKVTNGLFFQPQVNNTKRYDVYSYFPYKGNYCGDPSESVEIVNSCSFGKYKSITDLFENKIPNDLHGCKVRVGTIIFPPYTMAPVKNPKNKELLMKHGLEINMINFMSKVVNFTVEYSVAINKNDWGTIYENGTATGSLLYLQKELIDILIGAYSVTLERLKYYDVLDYDFLEAITMCVPHALDKSQWEKLTDVMSLEASCTVVLGYLFVSFSLWMLAKQNSLERPVFKKYTNTSQISFAILVSNPSPQPNTFKIRMTFFVWVLFCLHVTVAYQTSLMSFLTKPRYQDQVKTMTDIVNNNYTVLSLSNARKFFFSENNEMDEMVEEKMVNCDDIPACLRRIAFQRDAAMGSPRLYMKYALNNYRAGDGTPLLYCFENSVITYSLGMLMWKGFPLKPILYKLLSAMSSSGFIMKWEKEIFAAKLKNDTEEIRGNSEHHKLNVLDLEGVFILWMAGNLLATIVFCFEVYHYRRSSSI